MKVYRFNHHGIRKLEEREAVRFTAQFAVFASGNGSDVRESFGTGPYQWSRDRESCIKQERSQLAQNLDRLKEQLERESSILDQFNRDFPA